MARVSIYIPDDLKARMDEVGEAANWSEIVRPAILSTIASHEHRRNQSMTTVIERLKASKEKHLQQSARDGNADGRAWASDKAEYDQLVRVVDRAGGQFDLDMGELQAMIDPEGDLSNDEFAEHIGVDRRWFDKLPDDYAKAFAEGAAEIFLEVEDKL